MNTKDFLNAGIVLSDEDREFAAELFREEEDNIDQIIWSIIRTMGGEFDDLKGMAQAVLLTAYYTYGKEATGISWKTWLRNWVRWELIDYMRSQLTTRKRYEYAEMSTVQRTYNENRFEQWLEGVSEDARTIVGLVVDGPEEFAMMVQARGGQYRNYRSSLREYLDAVGWSTSRVAAAFEDIRSALASA